MKNVTVKKSIIGNHIIREVIHQYEQGEEWHKYVIIPRELALQHVRKTKAKHRQYTGYTYWMCDPVNCVPDGCLRSPSYNGPGRWYTNSAVRYRSSRRFVVFYQSGGLDV